MLPVLYLLLTMLRRNGERPQCPGARGKEIFPVVFLGGGNKRMFCLLRIEKQ